MKKLITIILLSFSFLNSYSINYIFDNSEMYKFYKEYYSKDIESFKEPESSIREIFNQCYNDNNFEFDFKIALYSVFVNKELSDISENEKVSLVVYMMKQDLNKENIVFYKKRHSDLSYSCLIDFVKISKDLIKNVIFVESREEMFAKEHAFDYNNEYYIPKGCYDLTIVYINKYAYEKF
ncbi:MAG: hypothetical protein U0T07_12235 [Chitinophagales bacterium]